MKPAINDASARQRAGGPPPAPSRDGESENRPRRADIIEVEEQIAELVMSIPVLRHLKKPPAGSRQSSTGANISLRFGRWLDPMPTIAAPDDYSRPGRRSTAEGRGVGWFGLQFPSDMIEKLGL